MQNGRNPIAAIIVASAMLLGVPANIVLAEDTEPDISKLAILRVEIPQFEKVFYREMGRWPSEGQTVRVDIHKEEAPFDVYALAYPKAAQQAREIEAKLGMKVSTLIEGSVDVKDEDGVTRPYRIFVRFNNEWAMYGNYNSGDIARIALWPGRYTISFSIVNRQGGSLSGILPSVKLNLKPGQYEVTAK